jgi:hypothetical protein
MVITVNALSGPTFQELRFDGRFGQAALVLIALTADIDVAVTALEWQPS